MALSSLCLQWKYRNGEVHTESSGGSPGALYVNNIHRYLYTVNDHGQKARAPPENIMNLKRLGRLRRRWKNQRRQRTRPLPHQFEVQTEPDIVFRRSPAAVSETRNHLDSLLHGLPRWFCVSAGGGGGRVEAPPARVHVMEEAAELPVAEACHARAARCPLLRHRYGWAARA